MALIQPTTETVYPNTEAHAELKAMMNRYVQTKQSILSMLRKWHKASMPPCMAMTAIRGLLTNSH